MRRIVEVPQPWVLPSRDRVGVACLIIAESAVFLIFVVAYLFYVGKSMTGPTPRQVLSLPVFASICLFASSGTIAYAVRALRRGRMRAFGIAWGVTVVLGAIFLVATGFEWARLMREFGLFPATNLFGTTYYSLVGLHAFHVTAGLVLLITVLVFSLLRKVRPLDIERVDALSLYWHFVDWVWVVILTVVYGIGR
jgi:cytochrome c oxidase subunit 3/cytochrome o ubiquinol oxidase subunit 3